MFFENATAKPPQKADKTSRRKAADLAHPVERHLAKVEVASSSLVIRSNNALLTWSVFLYASFIPPSFFGAGDTAVNQKFKALCITNQYGLVAQPGERCVRNAEVEGSTPLSSTTQCGGILAYGLWRSQSAIARLRAQLGRRVKTTTRCVVVSQSPQELCS